MFYLHKILPMVFLPIGLTTILVCAGLLLRRRILCYVGIGLLWLSSMPLIGDAAIRAAEGWRVRVPLHEVPLSQAIVVLSNGFISAPGDASVVEWSDDVDRFEAGVALYHTGKGSMLILTGGWLPWSKEARSIGELLAEHAMERGIPRDRVAVTGKAMNTAAEAQAVAALMDQQDESQDRRVILVTSAFHMRRAQWLFERAGLAVFPFPVDFQVDENRGFTVLDLLPSAEALSNTETALRELYGYLYYVVRALVGAS